MSLREVAWWLLGILVVPPLMPHLHFGRKASFLQVDIKVLLQCRKLEGCVGKEACLHRFARLLLAADG